MINVARRCAGGAVGAWGEDAKDAGHARAAAAVVDGHRAWRVRVGRRKRFDPLTAL
jgi:hypothetical protein